MGAVESLDGIIALGLAVPLGWIADRYGRVRIMKQSLVVGFLGIAGMVWGIATNTKLLIFLAVPFMSSYNQNVQQGVQTLIGDHVPPGQQRTKVLADVAVVRQVSGATAPLLQVIYFSASGRDKWEFAPCQTALILGLMLFLVYAPIFRTLKPGRYGVNSVASGAVRDVEPNYRKALYIEFCGFLIVCGSGMTFKFWALFLKNDYNLSPTGQAGVLCGSWTCMAICSRLAPKVQMATFGKNGRMQTAVRLSVRYNRRH